VPRFAANLTMMFTELSFRERFAAARAAGFDAVECLFPYELEAKEFAELLSSNGLEPALFNLSPGDWAAGDRGLACLPDRREAFERSVDQALDHAVSSGTRRLHMMAGLGDPADLRAVDAYLSALEFAAQRASPHGISIMIEPINNRDMPGYFLNSYPLALSMIEKIGLPNVKLQFDIYHRQILHGDVTRALEQLMPVIGHVQVAAVPHRHEPGSGELDDFFLFRTLDALGYTGFVGCEYRPEAGTLAGLGWFARARMI
jgi:hydroxypyruvate isomerase